MDTGARLYLPNLHRNLRPRRGLEMRRPELDTEPEVPVVLVKDVPPPDAVSSPFNDPVATMAVGESFVFSDKDLHRVKAALRRTSSRKGSTKRFTVRKLTKEISRVWRIG